MQIASVVSGEDLVMRIRLHFLNLRQKFILMPVYEKTLNLSIFIAILVELAVFTMWSTHEVGIEFITYVHHMEALILCLFLLDLARHYINTDSHIEFLKGHWFSISLMIVVLISFSLVVFPGAIKTIFGTNASHVAKVGDVSSVTGLKF